MQENNAKQKILDEEHLRLLSLFHYITGATTILFSCIFIIHFIIFSVMAANPEFFPATDGQDATFDPTFIFGIFRTVIGVFIFIGVSYGVLKIVSGWFISQRRYRLFSFIVILPSALFIPYGTILAICTLIVLQRQSVKHLYAAAQ